MSAFEPGAVTGPGLLPAPPRVPAPHPAPNPTLPPLPTWRVWLAAARPFSLTASVIPVLIGTALSVANGTFYPLLFLLALASGVLLQVGTNLVNSYYDYLNGLDNAENKAHNQPVLVLGWMQPQTMLKGSFVVFLLAVLLGVYLVAVRGWLIAVLGIIGLLGGFFYTARPVNYKYLGLGVPLVFILMGVLMVVGAYAVQTGRATWAAVVASLPISCLVAAILHANDLRDFHDDRKAKVTTLTTLIGPRRGAWFYDVLIAGAYLTVVLNVILGLFPVWTLAVFLTLPEAFRLMQRVHRGGNQIIMVEPLTARLHMLFGLILTAGVLVSLL
ncbi:MAG: 1,4-dihydroxy-2-naphthoate octaprenyltransferase [Limnochordales bacterium]|nr:1,4-dihydroxy-2-naphthoate octaprenyltransferase [Limnochordales bacterium]